MIKRCRNKKYYDKVQHVYVPLYKILEMSKTGIYVKVIDEKDQDITEDTLVSAVITNGMNSTIKEYLLGHAKGQIK